MEAAKNFSALIPFLAPYPVWVKVVATLWAVVTSLLVAGLLLARDNNISSIVTQTAVIPIVDFKDNVAEIFYPSPFSSQPHLVLQNNGYLSYQLLEQRADGFKLKIQGSSSGATLVWTAQGQVKN